MAFDLIAKHAINSLQSNMMQIPEFYKKHLQYEIFFEKFKEHLLSAIHGTY